MDVARGVEGHHRQRDGLATSTGVHKSSRIGTSNTGTAGARERKAEPDQRADGELGGYPQAAYLLNNEAPQQGVCARDHQQRGEEGHQYALRQVDVGPRP